MAERERRDDDDRVSLAPLDAETALRALLAVDPDDDAEDGKAAESEDPSAGL